MKSIGRGVVRFFKAYWKLVRTPRTEEDKIQMRTF
jgi:hypothetical protein